MSPRLTARSLATFGHDVAMAAAGFWLSLFIRLGGRIFEYSDQVVVLGELLFVITAALVFWWYRLDAGIWRYAAINDVAQIFKAAALANLLFLVALFLLTRLEQFPRSTVIINTFVLTALLAGPRLIYRIVKERHLHAVFERGDGARVPVLLVGADDAAELF
ncbi:MAG: polysaccharide biosynthesis protein, partial [Alphaproteobacteria bacterium]|nr:polysaccharide biosynthesis protein [Alphaproteobacteria bacterium]